MLTCNTYVIFGNSERFAISMVSLQSIAEQHSFTHPGPSKDKNFTSGDQAFAEQFEVI